MQTTLKFKLYILVVFIVITTGYFVLNNSDDTALSCSELSPKNPYAQGTGEYAGFEWSMLDRGSRNCEAYNEPFIAGCMEHIRQSIQYNNCLYGESGKSR